MFLLSFLISFRVFLISFLVFLILFPISFRVFPISFRVFLIEGRREGRGGRIEDCVEERRDIMRNASRNAGT